MANSSFAEKVGAVRSFNRFYTGLIGLLNEGLLKSSWSLTEARILYEIGHRKTTSAAVLARDLRLDPAYLSRILRTFKSKGLVSARRSERDGRARILALTAKGRAEFARLDTASSDETAALLKPLPEAKQRRLVRAMNAIRAILAPDDTAAEPYTIRPHRPGDIGQVISRHGALYVQEYGWDETFEGFVADIAGDFLKSHDPSRERCWIAERDGEIAGSVFIVDGGEGRAKLRMLYVEPEARGLGIGARLVDEAVGFARAAGYARVTLWTNDILHAARRIYEAAGFTLVSEEKHHSFGKDLVGQTWTLEF